MGEKHDWFCMIRYDLKPHWENLSAIDGPCAKGIYVRCSPTKLGINARVGNVTTFLSPCDAANVVTRHLSEWLQLHCCLWLWPAMPLSQRGLQYCVSRSFRFWESADVCLFGTRRIWNVTLQGCTTTCDAKACGSIGCAQSSATISNPYRALQRNQRRRRTSKASRAVGKQKPRLQRTSRRTTCEFCKIPCIYHAMKTLQYEVYSGYCQEQPVCFWNVLACLGVSIFQVCQSTSFKSATWPVGQMSREINFRCHSNLVHFVVPGHLHRSRHNHTQLMGSLITITYSRKYFRLCDSCNRLTHLTMFDLMSWYVLMAYCVRASEQDMGDLA